MFDGTGVKVTVDGVNVLGCPIGSESSVSEQIEAKVACWCKDVLMLAEIARTQPQAAYSSFVHGVSGRWTYFFRTRPLEESQVLRLEDSLRNNFIPSLTGKDSVNDLDHE